MADKDIIQNIISRLGQCQDERSPQQLDPHFVEVDERSAADLIAQARALAEKLRFYRDTPDVSTSDWRAFFPEGDDAALLARRDGQVAPHLGLFAAFAKLYQHPQQTINTLTGRHLDYQFRDVLRFEPKPAQADHAHLLLELKKGVAPLNVTPEMTFTAGKDGGGIELIYRPVRETVIGHGKVEALHSVFRDADGVHFAPVANSSDGLGGTLNPAQASWRAFGGPASLPGFPALPAAPIGCAFSSPVLRMQEGNRTVQLDLHLTGARKTNPASAFAAWLTGPRGWLGPFALSGEFVGDKLTLTATIPDSAAAVVDYDSAVHGHAFTAHAPVLQLLLEPGSALHYADFETLTLGRGRISVGVDAIQSLTLENDYGSLNPKKAFQPFGAQPVKDSRFMIGCAEALSKNLLNLAVKLNWQGAPANLYDWYLNYSRQSSLSNGVSATLAYRDKSGQTTSTTLALMARDSGGITRLAPATPPHKPKYRSAEVRTSALLSSGSLTSREAGLRFWLSRPVYRQNVSQPAGSSQPRLMPPEIRQGFITVSLLEDFLHADYRRETIANALARNKTVLNEPYTPTVQTISLGYRAQSEEVDFGADDLASFSNPDLQFFHVGCFGQRREHAWLRQQCDHVSDKRATLLPAYQDEGEFLIGLSGLKAGDSVNLLMQVSEGSAAPDLPPAQLNWSVLGDNYWRALTPQELALDTSNNLRGSGIVSVALPHQTTTEHSWMPSGRVWLRASVTKNSTAACQLLAVAANAVEVVFADQGNDPAHLSSPLAANTLAKFKTAQSGVKSVAQPYASFGGSPQETDAMLTRRAAERLRHRARCITPWDYERMLLDAFPAIHKVKCIPHASADSWLAPGHVLLVVIPDLRNRNAADQLRPRADLDTLSRMQEYAQQHAGSQVKIKVKNPDYQPVRLDFKVRFYPGYPFNYYRQELEKALIAALTPWAYDKTREVEFGGRIYRSVLLNFVEELPYVDFVTDFKMSRGSHSAVQDVPVISADAPDIILVSDANHTISEFLET